MKKAVALLLALSTIFLLCACGETKSMGITDFSKTTTIEQIKKSFGDEIKKYDFDGDYEGDTIYLYKDGTMFCGIVADNLKFTFDSSGKLRMVSFSSIYDGPNKTAIDEMVNALYKLCGNPQIENKSASAFSSSSVSYSWDDWLPTWKQVFIYSDGKVNIYLRYNTP